MSFADAARKAVLKSADDLEREAHRIDVFRSMDATESADWLRDIARQLRAACEEPPP